MRRHFERHIEDQTLTKIGNLTSQLPSKVSTTSELGKLPDKITSSSMFSKLPDKI